MKNKFQVIGLLILANLLWIITGLLRFLGIAKETALYVAVGVILLILYAGFRYTLRRNVVLSGESED